MATYLLRLKGQQFFNSTIATPTPLAGGLLYYYIAGTSTLQTTYSEQTGTVANSNPIQLDANGRLLTSVYLGSNNDYKEVLTDANGVTQAPWPNDGIPRAQAASNPITGFERLYMPWTQVTTVNSPFTLLVANAGAAYEIDCSGGNVVINLPGVTNIQAGTGYTFKRTDNAPANSCTIVPNGTDPIDGINAAYALSVTKTAINITSDGAAWQVGSGYAVPLIRPGGRLTPTAGTPVIALDAAGVSTVFYTAYESALVPVWGGNGFIPLAFSSDLLLTLNSTILPANAIVDVFAINNSGMLAIGAGPFWSSATPGSCTRGTGTGTTQLARQNGLWVNAVAITLKNGATTYANVAAGQATYLGSIFGDSTAGQVTCNLTYGQSRKFGIWNAFNRVPILLKAGDSTASWNYATGTWRPSNNNSANSLQTFTGLAEEMLDLSFIQFASVPFNIAITNQAQNGIGLNSTSAPGGKTGRSYGVCSNGQSLGDGSDLVARYLVPPSLGINTVTALENGNNASAVSFSGTEANMLLSALYRG